MLELALLPVFVFGLYHTRKQILWSLQAIVLLLRGNKKLAVFLYTLLFFPGIMLHEISHFFMAALLGVRTGDIEILPKTLEDSDRVALGSVKVAKTDFVRSSLIGAAPFISGSIVIVFLYEKWLEQLFNPTLLLEPARYSLLVDSLITKLLWLYALIVVSNTMFASQEDTRGWPVVGFLLIVIAGLLWWQGSLISTGNTILPHVVRLADAMFAGFLFALILSIILALLLRIVRGALELGLRKKIVMARNR